jgi:N-acetylneuraminate lyase
VAVANGLPVICYNIPGLTNVTLSVAQLAELMSIPGVEGIKFSDSDLPGLSQLAALCPGKVIFNGLDALLSFGLQYGAHGGIGTTYNILPELYLEVDRLVRSDKCAEAITVQKRANAANSGYKVAGGKQMQSVKQILIWQGLLEHASMAQAQELTAEEVEALRAAVESNAELAATLVK